MAETIKRSLLKTLSWRLTATLTTILLVYFFTNEWKIAALVGGTEAITKTIIYYFHERVWARIET